VPDDDREGAGVHEVDPGQVEEDPLAHRAGLLQAVVKTAAADDVEVTADGDDHQAAALLG
jgi:hypothetical protein